MIQQEPHRARFSSASFTVAASETFSFMKRILIKSCFEIAQSASLLSNRIEMNKKTAYYVGKLFRLLKMYFSICDAL